MIIGTGAVAAELTSFIEDTEMGEENGLKIKGYIDYEENIEKYWKHYGLRKPVLNNIDDYKIDEQDTFVIGISDIKFRKKMTDAIIAKGGEFINLIHPTAIIAGNAVIGIGNIINPYCIIGPDTIIGNFNLLTSQSIISHDSVIGNNNLFSTSLLCGHVKVQDDNSFGVRSTLVPHITVGNRNKIQPGMIVDRDVEDDSTVFYRFKEKIIAYREE